MALYNFTPEEEEEVIAQLSLEHPKVWKSLFVPDTPMLSDPSTSLPSFSTRPQATPPPLEAMSPLNTPQLPPTKRVELDNYDIDIDLTLEKELVSPAPVAEETSEQPFDYSHITPAIQRTRHTPPPASQATEPRRSARLAQPTPIPFTPLTEENTPQPEDIKESGTESDTEHPRDVVRGVKSAEVRLNVDTGRNMYYYETQWEGYPDSANTWQIASDFDRNPTTKAMLRTA